MVDGQKQVGGSAAVVPSVTYTAENSAVYDMY